MRNVIVTGGSRGIGLGIACRLASQGYRVLAIARKENDKLKAAMETANAAAPGSLQFFSFDLAATEKIPELVRRLRKEFGAIYGLVNNAGISFGGTLCLMPTAQIQQLIRLNTVSPIVLTKYVVRAMIADGGGRIVNIASVTAFTGYNGLAVYSATKASLVGFSRSLAREVGGAGVTVNSIAPGFIETDMTRGMEEKQLEKIKRRSALKRLAEIEDVANAVEFLLSDKARNITGTVLTVDAGSTA